jgi:L-aspartate-alpha-decarboxylase
MLSVFLKAKLHHLTVTAAELNYQGSLTLDPDFMEMVGLRQFERILVANLENGERFETYAISGLRGSKVCCLNGATAHKGAVGDRVIVFSPFYENYVADTILSGAEPIYVALRPPDFAFDPAELRRAFEQRPKALILCNPSNPSGKVFRRDELELIAALAQEFDAFVITDEVYEHIVYEPNRHVYFASLPGIADPRSRLRPYNDIVPSQCISLIAVLTSSATADLHSSRNSILGRSTSGFGDSTFSDLVLTFQDASIDLAGL